MKSALFITCLFFSNLAFAQEEKTTKPTGQTSFYAELGGPGILFSANIDRRFSKNHLGIGARVGVGFVTTDTYDDNTGYYEMKSVVTFPIQVNYLFGKPKSPHTFEVGAGVTFSGQPLEVFNYDSDETHSVFTTFAFMYRRQPKDGGFSWRIGFTPIIAGGYVQPSAAASIGYNF